MIKSRKEQEIQSVEDWFNFAPPARGIRQWVDSHSAKELAKAWFQSGQEKEPRELVNLLNSKTCTSEFRMAYGIAECETKLDDFGKGRIHDLLLLAESKCGRILISIEAKVDEAFGEIISRYMLKSVNRSPKSKIPDRIKYLSEGLFGSVDPHQLRYQLVHAVAGTLVAAKKEKASQCIFVVHQFVSPIGRSSKALSNDVDLNAFVRLLTGADLVCGELIGPIFVPGNEKVNHETIPCDIPLYIGKIETIMDGCE